MKVVADFSELQALADTLGGDAPEQATAAVRKVAIAEGTAVQARAKAAAPRDRPWLASSGIRRRSGSSGDAAWSYVFTAADPEGRPSGFFVEYGTSVMPPQPFMGPAAVASEQTFPAAVLAAIDPFRAAGATAAAAGEEG